MKLEVKEITKEVLLGNERLLKVLDNISFETVKDELISIIGPSGCGKTTLLRIIAGLEAPSKGEILLNGSRIEKPTPDMGMIFQEYSLIGELTIMENVFLPGLCSNGKRDYRSRAREMLEIVGLGQRLGHYPNEISGGEQQRVAIARSLINEPKILFADEPTASLDVESALTVLQLFKKLNRELGQTIVMVTHEPDDEIYVDRVIRVHSGLILENE